MSLYSGAFANSIIGFNDNISMGPIAIYDNKIVVTGDSYAGLFCDYESNKNLLVIPHAKAGRTIVDNKYIMLEAIDYDSNNILVSIGVNDQFFETPLYRFEFELRNFLNNAFLKRKTVYFHTYLRYYADSYYYKMFSSAQYDAIIIKLCNEYPNAHYIDIKDLESIKYIGKDNIHYNKIFYDELYNRLIASIYLNENDEMVEGFTNSQSSFNVIPSNSIYYIIGYDRSTDLYCNGQPMISRVPIIGGNNYFPTQIANGIIYNAYLSISKWCNENILTKAGIQDYFLNNASIISESSSNIVLLVNCAHKRAGVLSGHTEFQVNVDIQRNRFVWRKLSQVSSSYIEDDYYDNRGYRIYDSDDLDVYEFDSDTGKIIIIK